MTCNNCVFLIEYNDHGFGYPCCSLCDNLRDAEKAVHRHVKCVYYCTKDDLKQYVYIREKLKIICEDSSYFREMIKKVLDK